MANTENIASRFLGQQCAAVTDYDPEKLVKIPRCDNRASLNLGYVLPFTGYDVWGCYEVSVLTGYGLAVNGMLKIVCPCTSPYMVESKSLKLYLNTFNMTPLGTTKASCIQKFVSIVKHDLSTLLDETIEVSFHSRYQSHDAYHCTYPFLDDLVDLQSIDFTRVRDIQDPFVYLKSQRKYPKVQTLYFQSDLLRSNCRVTNQPDWADILVYMEGQTLPDLIGFARYLLGHRQVNHFHEEMTERIYMDIQRAVNLRKLMVICLYTRRGGIDINPVRASHRHLIPEVFKQSELLNEKTSRQ